jgi:pilus assembly protein Flp/PilA
MLRLINRFRTDERGASAVEYAMLVVFIALAISAGASTFGAGLNTWFTNTAASLAGLSSTIPATTP